MYIIKFLIKNWQKFYTKTDEFWNQNIIGLYSDNGYSIYSRLRPYTESKTYGNTSYKLETYNYDTYRDFVNNLNKSATTSTLISWLVKIQI